MGNLHKTHSQKGEHFFYCPVKMNGMYGSPVDWEFSRFRASEYWEKALADLKNQKEMEKSAKEERAKMRSSKNLKAPGISRGYKY